MWAKVMKPGVMGCGMLIFIASLVTKDKDKRGIYTQGALTCASILPSTAPAGPISVA